MPRRASTKFSGRPSRTLSVPNSWPRLRGTTRRWRRSNRSGLLSRMRLMQSAGDGSVAHQEIEMKIGIAGTGRMGTAIAQRLLEMGHQVRAWNRTADKGHEALE